MMRLRSWPHSGFDRQLRLVMAADFTVWLRNDKQNASEIRRCLPQLCCVDLQEHHHDHHESSCFVELLTLQNLQQAVSRSSIQSSGRPNVDLCAKPKAPANRLSARGDIRTRGP